VFDRILAHHFIEALLEFEATGNDGPEQRLSGRLDMVKDAAS
jgi:hypothetical protein